MATTQIKRYPIRGALWGLLLGLGLALVGIGQSIFALGTLPPVLVTVGGVVVGVLWSMFAPPKRPKGAPPGGSPSPAADDSDLEPAGEA